MFFLLSSYSIASLKNLFCSVSRMRVQDIRVDHVDQCVTVSGYVHYKVETQRPCYTKIAYQCLRCGHITVCEQELDEPRVEPYGGCENDTCGKAGPFRIIEEDSTKIDTQEILICEPFGSMHAPYDQFKREIRAILIGNAVGKATEDGYYDFTGDLWIHSGTRRKSEYVLHVSHVVPIPDPRKPAPTADVLTACTAMSQRNKIKILRDVIKEVSEKSPTRTARLEDVYALAESEHGIDRVHAIENIKKMTYRGDLLTPDAEHIRLV
jgi:DNA replicative helicase MCM subunit Mcm2 (Cdc46/Mcm family)